jgi:hypothetical protein
VKLPHFSLLRGDPKTKGDIHGDRKGKEKRRRGSRGETRLAECMLLLLGVSAGIAGLCGERAEVFAVTEGWKW